jgi:hypothetical protein
LPNIWFIAALSLSVHSATTWNIITEFISSLFPSIRIEKKLSVGPDPYKNTILYVHLHLTVKRREMLQHVRENSCIFLKNFLYKICFKTFIILVQIRINRMKYEKTLKICSTVTFIRRKSNFKESSIHITSPALSLA